MSRYWPMVLAKGVGYQWPTPRDSNHRASSPRLEQGGSVEILIQGIWPAADHSPRNRISTVVGLATPGRSAHPTAPLFAGVVRSWPRGPSPVPLGRCPSANAWASQVPSAPTRRPARGVRSADADDKGRSEFPLGPPSFAPQRWPASPSFIVRSSGEPVAPPISQPGEVCAW